MIGIYKIINTITNDYYLGSSADIESRWKSHRSNLNNNHHINQYLQNAWNFYGETNFLFTIELSCDGYSRSELFATEQFFLDTTPGKYNLSKSAGGGDNISNHPDRLSIIEKISSSLKNKFANMSEEARIALTISRSGENNNMFDKHHSKETNTIIRQKLIEYYSNHDNYIKNKTYEEVYGKRSAEIKEKLSAHASTRMGDKNPFHGKHHSESTKKMLSEQNKDKYRGNQNTPVIIDNIYYSSLMDASKATGIPICTVRWRVLSKNKKFSNYRIANGLEGLSNIP